MYLSFAWRYFKAKESANAINIIAWITAGIIAIVTCCQVLVLSVFNGFEGLVKSLYSSFYSDIRIAPVKGKTFLLDAASIHKIKSQPYVMAISMVAEDKGILQNGDAQTFIQVKGVDEHFKDVSGVPGKIVRGSFNVGSIDEPGVIIGSGVQDAAGVSVNDAFAPNVLTLILPKMNVKSSDPLESLSEGNVEANGVFAIQQDFDNKYAITNLAFLKQQMNFGADEYSAAEIKLKPGTAIEAAKLNLQKLMPATILVQSRFEQNSNLYNTMRLEKWAIFAVLTLIFIIAAFNMVSALTMLVLEKQKDISILQSMGGTKSMVRKIFLTEGLMLGLIGAATGILMATTICLLQLKFHFIKLQGGSFLIDYFPVKLLGSDFLLVAASAISIAFLAAWFPAIKASRQKIELR